MNGGDDPPDDQGDLFKVDPHHSFGGETFDPDRDFERLHGQLLRTWMVMMDGKVRTLAQCTSETSAMRDDGGRDSQPAISARLRDLRKDKFGAHTVEKYNSGQGGGGLWWYRLIPNIPKKILE